VVAGRRFYMGWGDYSRIGGWSWIRSGWGSGSLSLFIRGMGKKGTDSSQWLSSLVQISPFGSSLVRRYELGCILGRIGSLAILGWS